MGRTIEELIDRLIAKTNSDEVKWEVESNNNTRLFLDKGSIVIRNFINSISGEYHTVSLYDLNDKIAEYTDDSFAIDVKISEKIKKLVNAVSAQRLRRTQEKISELYDCL